MASPLQKNIFPSGNLSILPTSATNATESENDTTTDVAAKKKKQNKMTINRKTDFSSRMVFIYSLWMNWWWGNLNLKLEGLLFVQWNKSRNLKRFLTQLCPCENDGCALQKALLSLIA